MNTSTIEVLMLAPDLLAPHPANPPRRVSGRHAETLEASIKAVGILQPIIVRPHPHGEKGGEDRYQIIAGHRRWAAACKLGLPAVPCQVRELDDAGTLEILVVDNLEREDLTPLEEAHGVDQLVKAGWALESIADRLGRPAGWVRRRAKIASLSPKWTSAIEGGTHAVSRWGAELLEQIARLPRETQDAVLKENRHGRYTDARPPSKAELSDYLSREVLAELSGAPWDSSDATLVPKAGSCTDCVKRSTADPLLFEDLEPGKKKLGQCLDRACYETKRVAFVQLRFDQAKAEHPKLAVVKETRWGEAKAVLPEKAIAGHAMLAGGGHGWRAAKKDDPKAIPVFFDGGKMGGKVGYVAKVSVDAKKDKPTVSAAAIRELRRKKIVLQTLVDVCTDAGAENHDIIDHFLEHQAEHLWRWTATMGLDPYRGTKGLAELMSQVHHAGRGANHLGELTAKKQVVDQIIANMRQFVAAHTMDDVEKKWPNAAPLCDLLGIDLAKLEAEALVEIPEPNQGKAAKAAAPAVKAGPKRKLKPGKTPARGSTAKKKPAKAS